MGNGTGHLKGMAPFLRLVIVDMYNMSYIRKEKLK